MTDFIFTLSEDSFDAEVLGLVRLFDEVAIDGEQSIKCNIGSLKEIFDSLVFLAVREIDSAYTNSEHIGLAINRTQFIMDVMGDDENPNAPFLVQEGALDRSPNDVVSMWSQLGEHRDKKLGELELFLQSIIARESEIITSSLRREPPRLRLIHLSME